MRHKYTERTREWVAGGLRGECVALARKFRQRSVAERVSFIQRANAAKAAGFPSWKAMQREAKLHEQFQTEPVHAAPHMNGAAPDLSHASSGVGVASAACGASLAAASARGAFGACEPCAEDGGGTSGSSAADAAGSAGQRARSATATAQQRVAATAAGFVPSNETTHGMTTAELREKLAQAGVGVRMATAADFGNGLW